MNINPLLREKPTEQKEYDYSATQGRNRLPCLNHLLFQGVAETVLNSVSSNLVYLCWTSSRLVVSPSL